VSSYSHYLWFAENVYIKHAVENIITSNVPKVVAENPLDKLDCRFEGVCTFTINLNEFLVRSQEFTDRINQLAKVLNITPYPNSLVTLQAVRKVICTRLAPECVEDPTKVILEVNCYVKLTFLNKLITQGTPFPFQDSDLGFDLNDPVLNQAAKVLRMLYIHDLRDLQTKANELIVGVQNVTANPKTDTKIGQVGK